MTDLHTLQRRGFLKLTLDLPPLIILPTLTVQAQQRTEIELRRLQQLHLADVHVLQRVDALRGLLDLAANDLGDEFAGELGEGDGGSFALDDLGHFLADGADLGGGGICRLLDLVGAALREGNGEQADQIVVGRLDGDVGFNQSLPLSHQRAQFVRGEIQSVEVRQAVLSLDFVDPKFDLAEGVVFVGLQVRERDFEDTAFEGVIGGFETGRAVYEGFADTVEFFVSMYILRIFSIRHFFKFVSLISREGKRTLVG